MVKFNLEEAFIGNFSDAIVGLEMVGSYNQKVIWALGPEVI